MKAPNSNHFTGKKRFQTPRRKFGKIKNKRTHYNKYARFSRGERKWTNYCSSRHDLMKSGQV